ncbi:unnamed protein product [Urochloa humidicola]
MERLPAEKPPMWKLVLQTPPLLPIFTGSNIGPLKIILVDADTGTPVALQQVLHLEVIVLDGNFRPGNYKSWTQEKFEKHIVKGREGKRQLLRGCVRLTMRDGRALVGKLYFTDNSSWVHSGMFRIGARVVPRSLEGPRVLETISEAFVVRDQQKELYSKHYPPVLSDKVWRLDRIGKDGVSHRELERNHVKTVKDFLRMLTVKPDELRAILDVGQAITECMWQAMTSHARACLPGDEVYAYIAPHNAIYVNSVFKLIKFEFCGVEYPLEQMNRAQLDYVQNLIKEAYENCNSLQEVDTADTIPLLYDAVQMPLPSPAETMLWF